MQLFHHHQVDLHVRQASTRDVLQYILQLSYSMHLRIYTLRHIGNMHVDYSETIFTGWKFDVEAGTDYVVGLRKGIQKNGFLNFQFGC